MTTETEPLFDPGQGLLISGMLLILAGVVAALFAVLMPTSITTDPIISTNPYMPSVPSQDVVNIALQQRQMLLYIAGLAACIAGVVLLASGRMVAALVKR